MRVARTIGVRTAGVRAATAKSREWWEAAPCISHRGCAVDLRGVDLGQHLRGVARQRGRDGAVLVGLQRRRSAWQRDDHERRDARQGVSPRRGHRHRRPRPVGTTAWPSAPTASSTHGASTPTGNSVTARRSPPYSGRRVDARRGDRHCCGRGCAAQRRAGFERQRVRLGVQRFRPTREQHHARTRIRLSRSRFPAGVTPIDVSAGQYMTEALGSNGRRVHLG